MEETPITDKIVTNWLGGKISAAEMRRQFQGIERDLIRTLTALQNSEKNFEAMDTAMRTDGVSVGIAQEAFEAGMRDLREAKEILGTIEKGAQS